MADEDTPLVGAEAPAPASDAEAPADAEAPEEVSYAEVIFRHGYGFDSCLVFPKKDPVDPMAALTDFSGEGKVEEKKPPYWAIVAHKIRRAGLQIAVFASVEGGDLIFIKVRAPLLLLQKFASENNFKMALDEAAVSELAAKGIPEANIGPLNVSNEYIKTRYRPYEALYAGYDKEADELFVRADDINDADHAFNEVTRTRLIARILDTPVPRGGCNLDVQKQIYDGRILGFFPFHTAHKAKVLADKWLPIMWPHNQPIDLLRGYFGERVGFYFELMCHMATWLFAPGFLGVCVYILDHLPDKYCPMTPTVGKSWFSVLIVIWAPLWIHAWRRREAELATRWGVADGMGVIAPDRAAFRGDRIPSPVTGEPITWYPDARRAPAFQTSAVVTLGMVCIVIANTIFNVWLELRLVDRPAWEATYVPAVVSALTIVVLNFVYQAIAIALTDRENHRSDRDYENSLIIKLFGFSFANNYTTLIYEAYFANVLGPGCAGDDDDRLGNCSNDVAVLLQSIFISMVLTTHITKIAVPYVMNYVNRLRYGGYDASGNAVPLSVPMLQFTLNDFDPMIQNLLNFSAEVTELGYATLFVSEFALAPGLTLLSKLVGMRVQVFTMLRLTRRPTPAVCKVSGIGSWNVVFDLLSSAAIITNAGIIVFTLGLFKAYPLPTRFWAFFGFQYAAFTFKHVLALVEPDVPLDVRIQQERSVYVDAKLVQRVPDDLHPDEPTVGSGTIMGFHKEVHEAEGTEPPDEEVTLDMLPFVAKRDSRAYFTSFQLSDEAELAESLAVRREEKLAKVTRRKARKEQEALAKAAEGAPP